MRPVVGERGSHFDSFISLVQDRDTHAPKVCQYGLNLSMSLVQPDLAIPYLPSLVIIPGMGTYLLTPESPEFESR